MSGSMHRALLLCAGRGARLMPLTENCPKPMVSIAGRPILEWMLLSLRQAGFDEAIIIRGYRGEVIEDYFGDGARVGMRLHYRWQDVLSGTAGAMLLAEELCGASPFLLQWGDILVDPANYPAISAAFADQCLAPDCVLGMNWVEDPYAGGAVYRDGARVTKVVEKPPRGTAGTHWNIGGVIAFAPSIWEYLHRLQFHDGKETYVTEAIEQMIRDGLPLAGHEIIGERIHLTAPEDVARLHDDPRLRAWEASLGILVK